MQILPAVTAPHCLLRRDRSLAAFRRVALLMTGTCACKRPNVWARMCRSCGLPQR